MNTKKINFKKKKNKGFTIVELLVVITIIGVLSSFVSVGYFGYVKKSKEAVAMAEAKEIYQAIEIGISNGAFGQKSEGVEYASVSDLKSMSKDTIISVLETECGFYLAEGATFTLSDGAITYTNRDVTVTYNFK